MKKDIVELLGYGPANKLLGQLPKGTELIAFFPENPSNMDSLKLNLPQFYKAPRGSKLHWYFERFQEGYFKDQLDLEGSAVVYTVDELKDSLEKYPSLKVEYGFKLLPPIAMAAFNMLQDDARINSNAQMKQNSNETLSKISNTQGCVAGDAKSEPLASASHKLFEKTLNPNIGTGLTGVGYNGCEVLPGEWYVAESINGHSMNQFFCLVLYFESMDINGDKRFVRIVQPGINQYPGTLPTNMLRKPTAQELKIFKRIDDGHKFAVGDWIKLQDGDVVLIDLINPDGGLSVESCEIELPPRTAGKAVLATEAEILQRIQSNQNQQFNFLSFDVNYKHQELQVILDAAPEIADYFDKKKIKYLADMPYMGRNPTNPTMHSFKNGKWRGTRFTLQDILNSPGRWLKLSDIRAYLFNAPLKVGDAVEVINPDLIENYHLAESPIFHIHSFPEHGKALLMQADSGFITTLNNLKKPAPVTAQANGHTVTFPNLVELSPQKRVGWTGCLGKKTTSTDYELMDQKHCSPACHYFNEPHIHALPLPKPEIDRIVEFLKNDLSDGCFSGMDMRWTPVDSKPTPPQAPTDKRKHSHYFKDVSHLQYIDVYRVCDLFKVTDPCIDHAVKKLLCSGQRGAKDKAKDVQEAIDSLLRYQEMQRENSEADHE